MDFGRVDETELEAIDFSLPEEPAFNKTFLPGKKVENPKVYIGCGKWGRTEWLGKIYPPKTKEKDFLDHYVQHFNSIELNATHYKIWKADAIKKWADRAGDRDFRFCPKMVKSVTHFGSLKDKEVLINEFFKGVAAFEKHLGPTFIQVAESFSVKRKDELFTFLKALPITMQLFLEVRHPDWFANKEIWLELLDLLVSLKIGIVITDTSGRRDSTHMHITIPGTFIRFEGNNLHKSDFSRIDDWVERMKYWIDNGMQEIYFFMHMREEGTSPDLTAYLVDKMNVACDLNLVRPKFVQ
ncbi:MAG: DUF72 domain-containing protein [Saprospiraceae bacterium]